jgi:hypothetical protein
LVLYPNYEQGTGFTEWGRNFHITALLKDTPLRETLKDLTIGVMMLRTNLIHSNWLDFYDAAVWKDLDLVLSSITTLQRTLIHLDALCLDIPPQVRTGIRSSMPLIEQRGILIFKSNGDVLPERDMWTDRTVDEELRRWRAILS